MNKKLYEIAKRERRAAYCPYSNTSVGAALLTRSGKIYTGANIENASYSMTLCAERVAFMKAVSEGEREFSAIAVAGGKSGEGETELFYPCGACRQVMAEFCDGDFKLIFSKDESATLAELLPKSFTKAKLK